MQNLLSLIKVNLKIVSKTVSKVLIQPGYLLLTFLLTFIILGALVWISNYGLLFDILSSNLSIGDKWAFFLAGYESLGTSFTVFTAVSVVLIAVLSSINVSMLIFVLKSSVKEALAGSSKNLAAIIAGVIGMGCAACGTSILTPVVAGLGATAGIALIEVVGIAANILALVLLVYSIYKLAGSASSIIARNQS